ncbi:MAG: GNAT family N-acetyltransferase [Cyanobacteria bacterium P01_H01_bin.121]
MIRDYIDTDFEAVFNVINDAAIAYKGVIPADRWHEPYMTKAELREQIEAGVRFSCYVNHAEVIGVMGIQDKSEVALIRHAYVRTTQRNQGIGTLLLRELIQGSTKPILIGTWQAATWAIRFYEKQGFSRVDEAEKNRLLQQYWLIPERQVETSVVLVDQNYQNLRSKHPVMSAR